VLAVQILIGTLTLTCVYDDYLLYASARARYLPSDNVSNFAILVDDVPPESASEKQVLNHFNETYPDQVQRVKLVPDMRKVEEQITLLRHAARRRERAERRLLHFKASPERVGFCAYDVCACCPSEASLQQDIRMCSAKEEEVVADISKYALIASKHTKISRCAIVIVKTRRVAESLVSRDPVQMRKKWRVSRAPEPSAISWQSLSLPKEQDAVRNFVTVVTTTALVALWSVPVALIQGLANFSALSKIKIADVTLLQFLRRVELWSPSYIAVLEGCLPALILGLFHLVVPPIMHWLLGISRLTSLTEKDVLLRDWYAVFLFLMRSWFYCCMAQLLMRYPYSYKEVVCGRQTWQRF
jgi:hypothetical protein